MQGLMADKGPAVGVRLLAEEGPTAGVNPMAEKGLADEVLGMKFRRLESTGGG